MTAQTPRPTIGPTDGLIPWPAPWPVCWPMSWPIRGPIAGQRHRRLATTAALLLALSQQPAAADVVAEPPGIWQDALLAVAEGDTSGAEPLMRQAIARARAELGALLETDPERVDRKALADAYGRLGALLLLVEVEAQADAALRNAMQLDPTAFRWPYYAGYLAMLAGNLAAAETYLTTARGIDPDYAPLYLRLGKVRLDDSRLAAAREALAQAADDPALVSPVHYYLGQIALLERRFEDAVELLERALAENPDATEVHYPLAQAHRALGNGERAREHLGRFVLRAPDIHDPLLEELQAATQRALPAFKRAIHAVRSGDYATAADELAAGLAVDPHNAAARISYARVLFLTGRHDATEAQLSQALADAPDAPLGHLLLGALQQQRGDDATAEASYRRALALDPGNAGALFQLANLQFAAGRYADAAAAYAEVLALDDDVAPARLLSLVAALRAGTGETAVMARLDELLARHPQDPQLRYGLGRLLATAETPALRDPEQALDIAADLALRQPGPFAQRLLALGQAADGRFDDAARTQRGLLGMLSWMQPGMAGETDSEGQAATAGLGLGGLRRELAAYEAGTLPMPPWPEDDPLLAPPAFDAARLFKDYPATRPY